MTLQDLKVSVLQYLFCLNIHIRFLSATAFCLDKKTHHFIHTNMIVHNAIIINGITYCFLHPVQNKINIRTNLSLFSCTYQLTKALTTHKNLQRWFASDGCLNASIFKRRTRDFLLLNIRGFSSAKSKLTTKWKNLSHCNSPKSKPVIIQGAASKYCPTGVLDAHLKSSCVICHPSRYRIHFSLLTFYLN